MSYAQDCIRIAEAVVIGVVLGLPFARRPGGIRTHVLVAMGATAFCLAGSPVAGVHREAMLRVIQGVASGVGFVGAATVLKRGGAIVGINVAASIWAAAALGCLDGLGPPGRALIITVAVAIANAVLQRLERGFLRSGPKSDSGAS